MPSHTLFELLALLSAIAIDALTKTERSEPAVVIYIEPVRPTSGCRRKKIDANA
jgi:hypothetical protein